MANRPRRGRAVLNLGMQAARLRKRYPNGHTSLRGRLLTWSGTLKPTEVSDVYEVLVILEDGASPLVYVVSPALRRYRGEKLPHVFPHNTLCLSYGDDWGPWAALADTVLPWTAEWLAFYEVWLVTGEWMGGGIHPNGGRLSNGEVRRGRRSSGSRMKLLRAGLRQAYGSSDLEVLLDNARI